jgi:phage shock protein PspC (stress-responsive transcriptional regulator)
MEKKLYRDEYQKKLGGVCAGLAEYFSVDVAIIRVLFVVTCILHGSGLLVYIVLWIALPKRPLPFPGPTVDYTVPPENLGSNDTNSFGNSPYQNTSFGSGSFTNQPFPNQPFPNTPLPNQPRSTSIVAIIFGVILIIVGGTILLDNFDILPDWDFGKLWPIVLITVGCVLMLSGDKKKAPWDEPAPTAKEEEKTTTQTETTPPADNPPAE